MAMNLQKIKLTALFLLVSCISAFAGDSVFNNITLNDIYIESYVHKDSNPLSSLVQIPGLLYYKDFTFQDNDMNADYSIGSKAMTLTVDRSIYDATNVGADGILARVSTSNTPRYYHGYYDSTGFHHSERGIRIEPTSTNYLLNSYGAATTGGALDEWGAAKISGCNGTLTLTAPDVSTTLFNGAKSQRVQYTGVGGDACIVDALYKPAAVAAVTGDRVTLSCYVRSQGGVSDSVYVKVLENGTATPNSRVAISTTDIAGPTWKKISVSRSLTAADTTSVTAIAGLDGSGYVTSGESVDFEVALCQLEKRGDSTTYIPTTTVAATRNFENLTAPYSGNRNVLAETQYFKLSMNSSDASGAYSRYLSATDGHHRKAYFTSNDLVWQPNGTSGTSSQINDGNYVWASHQSFVAGLSCDRTGSSPYTWEFQDGTLKGTPDTDIFGINTGETTWYIGQYYSETGTSALSGEISRIAVFDRSHDSTLATTITGILNQ